MKILMDVSKDKFKEIVKDIAGNHEIGMDAYTNKETLKIIYIPSESSHDLDDHLHFYENDFKEIDENIKVIKQIEPPDSRESYSIMESFAYSVPEGELKDSLFNALDRKSPFANFNHIIHNSEAREDWFKHKTAELEDRVEFVLGSFLYGDNI